MERIMKIDDKPVIMFVAVCSECGATGTMNQVGGATGQHAPHCHWHPARVGFEEMK